ncbi:MAG: EAL domain-containing protein [Thiohalomonadaceae bacterium]
MAKGDAATRGKRFVCKVLDELFAFAAVLTPQGDIWYVNENGLRVVGRADADLVGKPFASVPWWDGTGETAARIDAAVHRAAAGRRERFDVRYWGADGQSRAVDLMISPLRDAQGAITHLVVTGLDVTDRLRAQQALQEKRMDLARAQAVAHVGNWRMDVRHNELRWSDEVYRMFGIPLGTPLTYEIFLSRVHPDDRAAVDRAWQAALQGTPYDIEHRILVHGEEKWVRERAELEFDHDGEVLGGFGTMQDVTERKRAEEELRSSRDFVEQIMASVASAVCVLDQEGIIRRVNPAATTILGYAQAELLGRWVGELVDPEERAGLRERLQRLFREHIPVHATELCMRHKDGSRRLLMVNANILSKGHTPYVVAAAQDITARKRMEDQIRHLAHHDPLTGLPNRRLFFDLADAALARARRAGMRLAVLYLDVDHFKQINDKLGHELGDRLLVQVAQRLQQKLRRSDTVARVGGDEFNVILADLAHTESAAEVAEQIRQAFREPFLLGDRRYPVTVSIGIGLYPDDGEDLETLLARADMAMYEAKARGRNAYHFFDPAIEARALARAKLETELRQALADNELELFYQPQVHIGSGRIVALEALVRWRHPERGLLAPAEFMPVAEDSGLTVPLAGWVLTTACKQLRRWQRRGAAPARVAVNLSRKQFHAPELMDIARSALAASGLSPECLELEVDEETLMDDAQHAAERLRQLADAGVRISVDNFGSGRTSLRWLQRMPVQRVKVDHTVVRGLGVDERDLPVVQAVIGLSHSLDLRVVAEGVETTEQLSLLAENGCDDAQGFLIASPRPPGAVEHVLFTPT